MYGLPSSKRLAATSANTTRYTLLVPRAGDKVMMIILFGVGGEGSRLGVDTSIPVQLK
jgi:hypothetical protein